MDGHLLNNLYSLRYDHIQTPFDLNKELENMMQLPQYKTKGKTQKLRQKFCTIIDTHSEDENKKSYFIHQLQYAHNIEELKLLLKEFLT
jgi:hypothetical protein